MPQQSRADIACRAFTDRLLYRPRLHTGDNRTVFNSVTVTEYTFFFFFHWKTKWNLGVEMEFPIFKSGQCESEITP